MHDITLDIQKILKSGLSFEKYILLQLISEDRVDTVELLSEDNSHVTKQNLLYLQNEMYIKIVEDGFELRKRGQDLFPEEKSVTFADFWKKYHEVTHQSKTDRAPAEKYWKSLKPKERELAVKNVESYYNSLNNVKFCKKARTYLRDKNFNDEYVNEETDSNTFVQTA